MNNNRLNTPVNSLVPLNVPGAEMINNLHQNVQRLNNRVNNVLNNTFNNVSNAANNVVNNVANVANNAAKNVGTTTENIVANIVPKNTPVFSANTAQTGWIVSLAIFGVLVFIFIVIFMFFQQQITDGMNSFFTSVRDALGMHTSPPPSEEKHTDVTHPSTPPDQEPKVASIAEKLLPTGAPGSEVFSVSKNTFTYYDAQPLCKALGAELATYDQVKAAWDKGADWCNYGWVKGQNAIFPTQTDTWQKLQAGPEEERGACGRPGINGGYFDNPELRFGVNCYGPKPAQSTHDESTVAKRSGQPLTAAALEVEKKVNKFRSEADNIGVLPFNGNKWSNN
jgi:hypothetical protein